MAQPLEYVRTDRNGTKIFHDWNCPRCGGAGRCDKWCFTGYECYQCGGTGKRISPKVIKEYTAEYRARLDERYAKRHPKPPQPTEEELQARAEETRRNNWVHEGFAENGEGYIYTGNTYQHKEDIKSIGGRWIFYARVYIAPVKVEGLNGVRVIAARAQDVCNQYGFVDDNKVDELIK